MVKKFKVYTKTVGWQREIRNSWRGEILVVTATASRGFLVFIGESDVTRHVRDDD